MMLQQNHIKDPAIMSTNVSPTNAPYINGQQNGNTKVVLVTSESIEALDQSRNGKTTSSSHNGTDEELTSLTWLNDKNLLKGNYCIRYTFVLFILYGNQIKINAFLMIIGINIPCPPNVKHINNNHLKIITDNVAIKPQSQQTMSSKSSSSGTATPTSDLVDDSGVSEDNASSVNSGSEQGNSSSSSSSSNGSGSGSSIYRTVRTTPKSFATTSSRERDSDAIDNEDIDDANNNTINKNRANANHHHQHHHQNQPPSASSIIHLSPGGSAVIEYKTMPNLSQKSNIIPNTVSSLSNHSSNPVIVSTHNGTTIHGTANIIKTVSTHQSSTQLSTTASTTPHTHFHKKYIKAMNALNGSGTDTVTTLTPATITNSNSEAQISSPSTIVSVSTPTTTIYTIPMKTEFRYLSISIMIIYYLSCIFMLLYTY